MVCYCPSCWTEVSETEACPACGADLRALSEESFDEKLIRALRHPQPTVPVRAATILGERETKNAVTPLIEFVLSTEDPYIQEAAVTALGRIGDPIALACLEFASRQGAVRVRQAAQRAIEKLESARKMKSTSEEE